MAFPHVRIRRHFAAGDNAPTAQEKGNHLEAICQLMFEAIPGIELVETKAVNSVNSIEIDLVFLNNLHRNGFPDFERVLLAECKNWVSPVDAAAIRDFRVKLQRKKRKYGFLLAANGVTGDRDQATAAQDEIRMALVEEGIFIIVLCRKEIEALRSTAELVRLTQIKIARAIIAA